jgi:hypothetical protein
MRNDELTLADYQKKQFLAWCDSLYHIFAAGNHHQRLQILACLDELNIVNQIKEKHELI